MSTTLPDISAALTRLRSGGIVAFPTETVYGLGADAFNESAVRRVYELKGRPSVNPLIVHVSGPEMAARLVAHWSEDAAALARMFWPGPLTIVLPRVPWVARRSAADSPSSNPSIPDLVTAGGPTIAVRCPDHPVALALLFGLGSPLVGPSANLSGQVSPTTAAHVREAFTPEDVMVLEGGPCRAGIESTVINLATTKPRILRPGLIGPGELAAVLGRPVTDSTSAHSAPGAQHSALLSPGLLPRHYAPRTPAQLFETHELTELLARTDRAVIIAYAQLNIPAPHHTILMPADAEDYAHRLYAALREADAANAAAILIQRPPSNEGAWPAILDRLTRATHE